MPRNTTKHPTELELEVLQVLWELGPTTGAAIRDALPKSRPLTYQSVMTILGIMEEKKYVTRKKVDGKFQYRARVTKKATSKRMLRDLVDRLFGGSSAVAMMNLLDSSDLDESELQELRKKVQQTKADTRSDNKTRGDK